MKMKKIIITVVSFIMLICISIPLQAGSDNDPEIVDSIRDVGGVFGLLPEILFKHIDITSAWFFEDETQPEYLFAAITVRDLEYKPLRAIYTVHWDFEEISYGCGSHIHSNGEFKSFFVGKNRDGPFYPIEGSIDLDLNRIIWKIPKNLIGNPEPNDVIIHTYAWTAIRAVDEEKHIQFGIGELVKDWAGYEKELYGNNYLIKY